MKHWASNEIAHFVNATKMEMYRLWFFFSYNQRLRNIYSKFKLKHTVQVLKLEKKNKKKKERICEALNTCSFNSLTLVQPKEKV